MPDSGVRPTYEISYGDDYNDVLPAECDKGAVLNDQTMTCYYFNSKYMSFEESRSFCQEMGGDIPYCYSTLEPLTWIVSTFDSIKDNETLWAMGTSLYDRDFSPFVKASMVTPSEMSSEGCAPRYIDDSLDLTNTHRRSACALPRQQFLHDKTEAELYKCSSDLCSNVGVCYNISDSLGETSDLNDDESGKYMCWCPFSTFGENCEKKGN